MKTLRDGCMKKKSPVLRNHDLALFFPIIAAEASEITCEKLILEIPEWGVREIEEYRKCTEIFKSKKMKKVSENVFEWDLS